MYITYTKDTWSYTNASDSEWLAWNYDSYMIVFPYDGKIITMECSYYENIFRSELKEDLF